MKKVIRSILLPVIACMSFSGCLGPHQYAIPLEPPPHHPIKWGRINAAQKQQAEQNAKVAMNKPVVKKKIAQSKTRYVAVPVKATNEQKQKSGSSNLVALYNTKTDKVQTIAYPPKKDYYSTGEEVRIGSMKAVVGISFPGI